MVPFPVFPTIPLSGTLSSIVDVTGARAVGIWIPVISSSQVLLRGSFDQNSADFWPIFNQNATPISSRWYVDAGPGSMAVSLDVGVEFPFPFIMIETAVAQAAVRSVAVYSKGF
ncbi:MAG TPA: hypothetical protein VGV13_13300 [Methylomirabilota bacterium]|jgi:hypothetical protein|nr:hypothetical protein [Methylomirabilota bacterium]